MAAGGIRVGGGKETSPPWDRTRNNRITDNWLHHYGQDFPSAVGVLLTDTEGNTVAHNHIHDGGYTGVSIGWVWGYQRSVSQNNRVEFNHIHHIGGVLSDMGGIYTLGVSPGTVIRNNHIHDVDANHYGGWGIYHDEGSTHLLVENNVVHHTKFAPFNIHFAKEVTVRNNIFALGKLEQASRGRAEPHKSVFFENNIVYWREGELLSKNWKDVPYTFHAHPKDKSGTQTLTNTFEFDWNLYFNPTKTRDEVKWAGGTWAEWQKRGKDRHSQYADPLFVNPEQGDFTLRPESPAFALGFQPIDLSQVGPRIKTGPQAGTNSPFSTMNTTKPRILLSALALVALNAVANENAPATAEVTRAELLDRIYGGWAGMLIGGIEGLAARIQIQRTAARHAAGVHLPGGGRAFRRRQRLRVDAPVVHGQGGRAQAAVSAHRRDLEGEHERGHLGREQEGARADGPGRGAAGDRQRGPQPARLVQPLRPVLRGILRPDRAGHAADRGGHRPALRAHRGVGGTAASDAVLDQPHQPARVSRRAARGRAATARSPPWTRRAAMAEVVADARQAFHAHPDDWKAARQEIHEKWRAAAQVERQLHAGQRRRRLPRACSTATTTSTGRSNSPWRWATMPTATPPPPAPSWACGSASSTSPRCRSSRCPIAT